MPATIVASLEEFGPIVKPLLVAISAFAVAVGSFLQARGSKKLLQEEIAMRQAMAAESETRLTHAIAERDAAINECVKNCERFSRDLEAVKNHAREQELECERRELQMHAENDRLNQSINNLSSAMQTLMDVMKIKAP